MEYKKVGRPCRIFSGLSITRIVDPLDGCEKTAFICISQGAEGKLVIAEYESGKCESYPLVMDGGAWALMQLPQDGSILVGTCNYYGSVQRFDMRERRWYKPLRIESEEYIWNFALGTDGCVYGGTWPGDRLLRYCPETHTLDDLGKVSPEPGNNYSRMVYGAVPGKIFISSIFERKRVTCYDIASGTFDRGLIEDEVTVFCLTEDFLCASDDVSLYFYDPRSGKRLLDEAIPAASWRDCTERYPIVARLEEAYDADCKNYLIRRFGRDFSGIGAFMENGDIVGVYGQQLFRLKKGAAEPEYSPIRTEPPAAFIHELIPGDDGKLWGASSFGMTIFWYDPKTGESHNTDSIALSGGEVYGMVSSGGKIYSTAYAGGEHIVYDPGKPWNVGENPRSVCSLGPKYIRPYTKSKIDKDGYIWTGWLESYGVRGQAITKWNIRDDTVEVFEHIIPQTGIFGLDITDDYIWFTTCNHANGLPDITAPLSLCAVDKEGNLVYRKNFDEGVHVGRVAFAGRYGVVQAGKYLYRIDSQELEVSRIDTVTLSWYEKGHLETMLRCGEDTVAVFDMDETIFLKPETGEVTARVRSPKGNPKELFYHGVFAAAMLDGTLYASVGADLYRLEE